MRWMSWPILAFLSAFVKPLILALILFEICPGIYYNLGDFFPFFHDSELGPFWSRCAWYAIPRRITFRKGIVMCLLNCISIAKIPSRLYKLCTGQIVYNSTSFFLFTYENCYIDNMCGTNHHWIFDSLIILTHPKTKTQLRVAICNVVALKPRKTEVVEALTRPKFDVCGVQEPGYKGCLEPSQVRIQGPLLLTRFNFNPSMDKSLHPI